MTKTDISEELEYIGKVSKINAGKNLKYNILTMGCQLNENDSEKICGMVEKMGYTETDNILSADLVIYNTCCVRENAGQNISYNNNQQTFYAEIEEIKDNFILVKGLSVNDINFRGEFTISVVGETELEWRNTKINVTDLNVGDNISITFTGEILDSYPAQIKDVVKIQLLDDEI